MPPRKDNLICKQKRLIDTRLMQISLLVEDYVYQEKPMSQRSAEAYIREISAYKDKCYEDARSLQVIEKLIRCMKGIIYEQEELQNVSAAEYVNVFPFEDFSRNDSAMLSPVYSTTDEDLTQIPQYIEVEDYTTLIEEKHSNAIDSNSTVNEDLNSTVTEDVNIKYHARDVTADKNALSAIETMENYPKNNITEHFNDKTQIDAADKYSLDNIKVIDLCDDETDELTRQNNYSFFHEPEFNIQNAISNLSIRDIEETFRTPFSQEYSQSILDNFYPNNSYSQPNDVVKLTKNNEDVIRTATITQQKPETKVISFNDISTKIVLPITNRKINVLFPLDNKTEFNQNINTEKMQNNYKQTRKAKLSKAINKKTLIAKNKNNRLSDSIETVTTINVSKTKANKKFTEKSPNTKLLAQKQKNIRTKANENKNKSQEEVHETFNTTKLSMQGQNNTLQTPKIAKPLTDRKIQQQTKKTTDKKNPKTYNKKCKGTIAPIPNIYNTTVVNDLSWIENIRFVREIPSEEHESLSVDEFFWENYTLPKNWNEDDFNY